MLTDGRSEFTGPFEEACRALDARHTHAKPRMPGPTASSSVGKARLCTSAGASTSAAAPSRVARRRGEPRSDSCRSIAGTTRVTGTGFRGATPADLLRRCHRREAKS